MNLREKLASALPEKMKEVLHQATTIADEKEQDVVLVGGMVRDLLLDRPIYDLDLMVSPPAAPFAEALGKKFQAKVITHPRFLTHALQFSLNEKVDIVTAREETYPKPGDLPSVQPATIEADLKRRDFTINAIACWLNKRNYGDLLDSFKGVEDLKNRVIRILHTNSFVDDPTRIYRAARFAGRFDFDVERDTQRALDEAIEKKLPAILSPVRRRHEFELILKEADPVPALELLEKWSALSFLHPEWRLLKEHKKGFPEGPFMPRLVSWLRPWGKDKARDMMLSLSFEKAVKKEVLSHL